MNPLVTGQCVFLGDYSFTRSINGMGEGTHTTTGEPLAGRTIDIPANTSFILVRTIVEGDISKSDYACRAENTYIYIDDEPVAVTAVTRGWEFAQADALAYDIEVQVSTSSENAGEWRLQDNLPDITLTELLKAIAAELGYILNYTEADGIIFDTIDTDTVTVKSLNTLTKKGEVVRTFGKYAQHNYVQFADDEQFQNVQFTAVDHTIDNDNISNDKTLLKLPWTCGVQDAQHVRDKAGRTKPLEIRFNPDEFEIYALFAKIEKNADIQNLCDRSTQIKIEAQMPLLQYDAIKPKTGLLVDGSTYLWTERSWQKDVLKLTLAQFGEAIVPPAPPTPILPPQYQQVEYIGSEDGMQAILTNIIFDKNIQLEVKTSIIWNGSAWGAGVSGQAQTTISHSAGRIFITYGNTTSVSSVTDNGIAEYVLNNANHQLLDKNGAVKYTYTNVDAFVPTVPLCLFCVNQGGYVAGGYGNIWYFRARRNTDMELLIDLIPCYRKADNVAGMYDIVNDVFYTNVGSGSFIVGPDAN
jgi:hypothetical protein